jgi:hypothetical protein
MGIGHRDYAPNLSPVDRPDALDAEQLEAGFTALQGLWLDDGRSKAPAQSDTLCSSCGNTSCPLDDKRATQCVEYYPLNPTEDACPKPTTTTT